MATTLDDPLGIDQRDPLGIEQSDPLGIEADKPLPSTLGLTNARSARGHIPNIETLPGDIRREYEQLPPEARFQLETLGGTLGASSRGAGQMMSYAGNVARAIPADIAALTKGVEAVPEAQGNLLTALKQPLVGDISRADGAPSRALPIDTALEAAREDAKERQAFPWAAIVGEVSQGVAETMPKMAALPLAGEGALAQGLASAGVFGLDNSGNFNPKSAVTMGLLPGVGKAVKGITAAGIGGAIATGATALENPVAQKVLEEIGHQAGLNAYMLAAESPELARLQQENPEEFRRQLVSIVANNLGFGLLGVKNWQGRVPSATERFIERNAEIFTQDVLARQVGRVAGRELGAATEQPLPRQLAEAEATIRSLPPGWRPPAEEISPRETGKADPLGIETGRGARVESPEPAQPPANPVVAKIDNLAAAAADLKAALTQNQIAAKPESSTAQTPESSTEKLLASPTTNPAAEAPAVAGKPVELPAAAQQRRPTTETTPPEVSTTGRGAGQPAPASLPVPKAAQLFDNLVREYGVPLGWTTGDEGFYDATLWQNNPGSSVGAKVQASKQLQAARERAASDFVPAGGDRGVATPEQRATLLPALIAHLKRELPDSANAVDAAQKLAEFGSTRETEPNAAQRAERFRQDRAILERIQSQHSGRSPLLGVSVVGDGTAPLRAGGTEPAAGGNRPRGLAPKVRSELERVFGVRIVQVAHPDGTARFNGAKDVRSNTILLDVNSDISPMAVAGHELWHHVELTDPALARDVRRQLVALMQNEEGFQARLALRGEQADNVTTVRELIGDWFGDNAARPDFWKTLAAKEPNVFRRLATRVKAWLDKILGRAKSYGVESHFSDVAEARRVVEQALADFARNRIAGENVKRTETPTAEEWDALLAPDKRRDLRDEGVTPENIEALLSGKKTAVQVVEEQLGVKRSGDHIDAETMIVEENGDGSRSIGFTPPAGPASTSPVNIGQMSHVDAIMLARDQGVDRINRILRGDAFSKREEEIKAARGYVPPRFQMDKPIVGPTGAKIVGYEWRSTMGEKWSNAKQEYVEARVSDWDNSDTSTGTGRDIVHVFYVEHPDGRVRPEGIRSAQNVLGINETRLMTIAKRERAAQQYREQQLAADVAAYEKTAKDTPAEAARDFRVRNRSQFRSFEEDNQLFNESVLFEKGGKYVRRLPSATENMVRHGWTVVENDAAIPGRVPPAVAEAEPIRAQERESQSEGGLTQGAFFSRREVGGEFSFDAPESVAEQKARVAAEKSKAESREAKAKMLERAGARLVSTEDTRTADMFASPEGRETRTDKAGQGSLFSRTELRDLSAEEMADPAVRAKLDALASELYGASYADLNSHIKYLVRLEIQNENPPVQGRQQPDEPARRGGAPERKPGGQTQPVEPASTLPRVPAPAAEASLSGIPEQFAAWQARRQQWAVARQNEKVALQRVPRRANGLVDWAKATPGQVQAIWAGERAALEEREGLHTILNASGVNYSERSLYPSGNPVKRLEVAATQEKARKLISEVFPESQHPFWVPGMRPEDRAMFSRKEGTAWQEQQQRIAEAEAELRERIAEQMTPPAGMTKAQAREAKNAAAAKVRNLRADLLQSPDYAEHLITQEAELVRQLNALVKPAGVTVGPDWLLGREEKLRTALDDTQIQRVLQLDQEWERVRGELELMPKKLLKAVASKLYPPPKPNAPSNLNVPSEWLTARLGDRDPVQTAEDVTTARERVQEKIKALADALRTGLHEARRFTQRLQAGARTLGNRDLVAATKDAADNKAHIVSRQAANVVLAELNRSFGQPTSARDPMREAALTFAIEAQDLEGLRLMREQVQGSEFSGGKWAGQAVDAMNYAEKHWDRLQPVADLYSKLTDAQVAAENEAGIKTLRREQGYVFHTHDLTENWAHLDTSGGAGGAATPFKNIRDYATYADSIAAGVSPKSLNAVDLLQRRLSLGQKLINYRTWVQQLRGLLDPATQQPLAADVVNRVRADGTPTETAPMGYQLMRFAGQTYAVHKAYANLFKALTTESNWRMSGGWQALMKTMTTAKHATLLFDTFHLGRIAYWNAITRGAGEGLGMSLLPGNPLQFKRGLLMLDQLPANLEKMVKEGELTREQADTIIEDKKTLAKLLDAGLNVGGVADNIYSDWVQHLPVAGTFNKWLFEKYQRGAMAGVSVIEYRRQRRMHPEMSDEQVARLTARAVNIRFGNLNSQAWIKSKFAQDLFRVVFLAPQWNESLLRSEFEAVKDAGKFAAGVPQGKLRVGTLGRAVATAFIGQFIANQIINFFTRGQPTWENPEEGMEAKISAWVPDVVGNSAGYFLNPLTLPAEMTHLILKGHERTGRWDEAIMGAVNSRLSSLGRFTAVFAAGKNSQGEAATGLASRIGLAAEEAAPLPIGAQAPSRMVASLVTGENKERYPGQFQRQIMQSVGIKPDSAPTPERRITALAQEFNRTRNVPDVERAHSPYSNLDGYLKVGNLTAAREELERLLVTREPEQILKRYELRTKGRFTGAAGRETDFFKTLNGEQRIQYKKAADERKRIQAQVQKLLRDMRVTR